MAEILNLTNQCPIVRNAEFATSMWHRFRGLMFRRELPDGGGLLIDPCSSIHMFFMRFPIDVLYLDRHDTVVRVQEYLKPWRVGPLWTKNAKYVVELPAGTISRTNTSVGDVIQVEHG